MPDLNTLSISGMLLIPTNIDSSQFFTYFNDPSSGSCLLDNDFFFNFAAIDGLE